MKPSDSIILFGATGFTGGLTAEYLARHAEDGPRPLRWAVAGRDAAKLDALRDKLAEHGPPPEVLIASVDDAASLAAMADSTRLVVTTVGPYQRYGRPVVDAAVEADCDYLDITGEPEFVAGVVERYHERARERGLRVVPCCGFDSVPHDLGAMLAVRALPGGKAIRLEGIVQAAGMLSGGTWQSAVEAMGRLGPTRDALSSLAGEEPEGCRARPGRARTRREPRVKGWVTGMPTIDPWIVLRSARLTGDYGPDFRYSHMVRVRSVFGLAKGALGLGAVVALAQLGPTRKLLLGLKKSGDGPDAETRARSRFRVTFFGEAGRDFVGTGDRVRVDVEGGDPGYGETSKMLAESALALGRDRARLPERAGVLTPATAFGEVLVERLRAAGMRFEVIRS